MTDRRRVRERARGRCEYCRIHEDDAGFRHEVDHVIAEKHGGATELGNLALACFLCNSNKGSDVASLAIDGTITRLYNPRTDDWRQHFTIFSDRILPRTDIGETTERIIAFNTPDRCEERCGLQMLNRYPTD